MYRHCAESKLNSKSKKAAKQGVAVVVAKYSGHMRIPIVTR